MKNSYWVVGVALALSLLLAKLENNSGSYSFILNEIPNANEYQAIALIPVFACYGSDEKYIEYYHRYCPNFCNVIVTPNNFMLNRSPIAQQLPVDYVIFESLLNLHKLGIHRPLIIFDQDFAITIDC